MAAHDQAFDGPRLQHSPHRGNQQQRAREVAVITHWGFVLALTGVSLRNGECVAFEPRTQRACSRRQSMIATHAPFIDER